MGKWLKRLFGGINSGGVIGACVGIPLGVSIVIVDVSAIHPAFYEAIAATIPVLLLAAVLLIRGEGRAIDQLEAPRRQRRREVEGILSDVQQQTLDIEEKQAIDGDDALSQRENQLIARLRDAKVRLHRLLDGLELGTPMTPVLLLLYATFAVGTLGEIAALAALGSGHSNTATYLSACLGVLGLLLLLITLERNALTRASMYRRLEDEIEEEFVAKKQRETAGLGSNGQRDPEADGQGSRIAPTQTAKSPA